MTSKNIFLSLVSGLRFPQILGFGFPVCEPNLHSHLRHEDELVRLEEPPAGVHVRLVGDGVDEVVHPGLQRVRGGGQLDAAVEHHRVGLSLCRQHQGIPESQCPREPL